MRLLNGLMVFAMAVLSASVQAQSPTSTPPPTSLRVIPFDGGWNLPIWAAQRQGFFEANGVAVQLSYTPSSAFLVQSLFDGGESPPLLNAMTSLRMLTPPLVGGL